MSAVQFCPSAPLKIFKLNNFDELRDSLAALACAGGHMEGSTDQDRSHLVIAFTDGFDTTSLFYSSEIASVAEHSDAVLYAVAIPQPAQQRTYATVLNTVTAITGGQLTLVEAGRTLDQSFAAIINQFRQGHFLRYSPSGVSSTRWHTLDVRVTGRGRVNARKGYWR